MAWTAERQAELERLAAEGLTGKEIGEWFGISRSAVLGRAHRTGVRLTDKLILNENRALEIRRRLKTGERAKDLAAEFGVDRSHISLIKAGKRWPRQPSHEAA